jgi:hypothetical protein
MSVVTAAPSAPAFAARAAALRTSLARRLRMYVRPYMTLWKERNARLFRGRYSSMIEFLQVIKVQAELWVAAGAKDLRSIASGA